MNQKDKRLEKVETVVINFDTFKKALSRNYLGERNNHDRSYVLRLYPPFEAEMRAEYYESVQGRHYDSNWDEKPLHIQPELLILEGNNGNFRDIVKYPEEWQIQQNLTEVMSKSKEMYWDEIKTIIPKTFNLGCINMSGSYPIAINWEME